MPKSSITDRDGNPVMRPEQYQQQLRTGQLQPLARCGCGKLSRACVEVDGVRRCPKCAGEQERLKIVRNGK